MKIKYCLVGLLALSSLVSCKIDNGENKPAPAAAQEEKLSTGKVMVTLNAIVPKNDDFQIFYNEDGTLDFDGVQTVVVSVTGKAEPQDIRFSLPDDALPASLRLDPGYVKEQGQITINSFTVDYYGKKITAKGADFFKYFQPNNNLVVVGNTLTPTVVNGNYDPTLYPGSDLLNDLKTVLVK